MKRRNSILSKLGVTMSKHAKILDFGCGAGRTVYSLLDQGYTNVCGYDIKDYLELRDPIDRHRFHIGPRLGGSLPFDDNTFDLILSEEVFEHVMDQVSLARTTSDNPSSWPCIACVTGKVLSNRASYFCAFRWSNWSSVVVQVLGNHGNTQ